MAKYFLNDPRGDIQFFDTEAEAKAAAASMLEEYSDHASEFAWHSNIDELCWGEVREFATEASRVERPPADEINEDGEDKDGNLWVDESWSYIVTYELSPA